MTLTTLRSLFRSNRYTSSAIALTVVLISSALVVAQQQTNTRPPQMPPTMPGPRDSAAVTPTGTGILSGTLSNANGARPVRRATMRLTGTAPVISMTATTDESGGFSFRNLPSGQFTITATKAGFLDAIYGQKQTGSGRPGTPITLTEGQQLTKVAMQIAHGGVIAGTVIDDIGEPAFGTRVQAYHYVMKSGERTLQVAATTTADDRGMYRMPSLPQGDYIVMATPPDSSDGGDIAMKAFSEQMATAKMAIGSGATMSFGPPPSANDDNAPSTGYAPVFYPGTTQPSGAQSVAIAIGEERDNLDLQLQLVPMGKITGTVAGDPRALSSVNVQLVDLNQTLPGLGNKSTRVGKDGKFSFTGVAPGSYAVVAKSGGTTISISNGPDGQRVMFRTVMADPKSAATAGGPDGPPPPPLWASQDVAVDGRQPVSVALTLQSGMTLSGKVAFEGGTQPPQDPTSIRVLLSPASSTDTRGQSAIGSVDADGHIKVSDVMPGNYKMTLTPPGGGSWLMKSIDVAGRDALDFPLEVKAGEDIPGIVATFTDKTTDVTGTLQDSTGAPTSDYTIVIFPQDTRFWTPGARRIMATRPATDGKFRLGNLAAGDYRLIAVTDVEPGQWYDPALLRQLMAGSIALTVNDGEHKVQDIRVAK